MPNGPDDAAPHLLAIDDDEVSLTLIRSVLSAYRMTTFSGPEEALAALQGGLRPDLIVCDVTMPGMTGFELHARLRDMPPLRSVPFVYLTALDSAGDRRTGMGLGADDYLTKPFTPAELRAAVESRLHRVQRLRDEAEGEWRVVTLGGLDVHVGEERLHWESQRAAELFLVLLEADAEGIPAETVRRELWWHPPDGNQLHALVSRLRKALDGHAEVATDGENLRLRDLGRVRWDVAAYERAAAEALEQGDLAAVEGALAAYRGDFLPDAESPWAERLRARLEETAMALHEAAIEASDGAQRERAERRMEAFLER
ncbi:MAG: response regulator [Deinococcus-Thermus bacterium]|jgi:two-component SAPR family response regulator|nr:response regulator [Deinococcota bacterium]